MSASEPNTIFLKLGGSLITDKTHPHTPRLEVLRRLAREIAAARATVESSAASPQSSYRLLLGHGSGSFGHTAARQYGTRQGVKTQREWRGFTEVWKQAAALNHLVLDALQTAGLPAIAFPPSASVLTENGQVLSWDIRPLQAALQANLLPVIYGDVVFDTVRGGTILSTEDLFAHLAPLLHPRRLLLAGLEPGVWQDFPRRSRLFSEITLANYDQALPSLGSAETTDVTGGMASKVKGALDLAAEIPGLEVLIFSAEEPGILEKVLQGGQTGTLLHAGNLI